MVESLGIFFALAAALVWGSSLVPLKLAGKVDDLQYSAFISAGIFLSTLIAMPFLNFKISFSENGLISGIMWAVANTFAITSINMVGLSRAVPIVGTLTILLTFLWGVLFFAEQLASVTFAAIGVVLLIAGVPLITKTEGSKDNSSAKWIVYAVLAGIIFGSYITPLKISGLQIADYIFSMVLGILLTNWMIYLASVYARRQSLRFDKIINSLSSGFMWTVGNITSLFAINSIGLSIGFPLTQLQLLIAVSWGVFYFHEVKNRQDVFKIILGAVLLMMGAVLLAFSK